MRPKKTDAGYSPERELPRGSIFAGVLGALLGAALGAVPYGVALLYLKPSLDNADIWEVLGLLIGYCGCLGYRGLKGRRSTALAFVIAALSSLLVMIAANLVAELFAMQVSLFHLEQVLTAMRCLLLERWKSVTAGLIFGLLGICSARSYLLWYTDPARAVQKYGESILKAPGNVQILPRAFVVRHKPRWAGAGNWLCTLVFAGLLLISLLGFDPVAERGWLLFSVCMCSLFIVGSVYSALRCRNYRLEADGEYLRYVSAFGRERDFYVGDIYGLERNALTGYYQLFDREGWLLGWFDPALENGELLVQYLREHEIGLGAKH